MLKLARIQEIDSFNSGVTVVKEKYFPMQDNAQYSQSLTWRLLLNWNLPISFIPRPENLSRINRQTDKH